MRVNDSGAAGRLHQDIVTEGIEKRRELMEAENRNSERIFSLRTE